MRICGVIVMILTVCFFALLAYTDSIPPEIETFTANATITDKDVVDARYVPVRYMIFWVCDGEHAGVFHVTAGEYARYAIGDEISVTVTITKKCGQEEVSYALNALQQ